MKSILSIANVALRAAIWRMTPAPRPVGLPGLLIWSLLLLGYTVGRQYWIAGEAPQFNPYGFNASLATLALAMMVVACFVRAERQATAMAALVAFSLVAELVADIAATVIDPLLTPRMPDFLRGVPGLAVLIALNVVWSIGAAFAIFRSLEPKSRRRWRLVRATGLGLAMMAATVAIPHDPVFKGNNFDRRSANFWEFGRSLLPVDMADPDVPSVRRVDRALVEISQPTLMDVATSHLAPQRPGVVDVYAIGLAGWSDQDVFVKELDGALEATAKLLPIHARTVKLVNHPDHAYAAPMASRQNFAATVRAIAQIMDKEEDVLLLFMTSHGSSGGVALRLNGALHADLSPEDVAQVLHQEGIQNRIIIVSACYAGVFVKPLADDHSIILTAADDKSASFGCSNEREWTYFGDAFFNQSLRPGSTFSEAFENAKRLIVSWETRDGITTSNPQAHFGPALVQKLESFAVSKAAAAGRAHPAQ